MNFELSEEQRAIQDMARAFAEEHFYPMRPNGMKRNFSCIELRLAAELGLAGIYTLKM